jgi:alkylhydroperoxidase family enzyme
MICAPEPCGAPGKFIPLSLVSPPSSPTVVAMPKTEMSRFPIHDDLTAPEESLPILKGASSAAGQLPNLLGVLAGAPAALKAYTRFRAELRHGALPKRSAERIGLAVAEHYGSKPGIQLHARLSRATGLGIDEVARAKRWDSGDAKEAALLRYLKPLLTDRAHGPQHLHEEAREAGWTDEQLLEAIAVLSMESFTAMVNVAGDVPVDGSIEETRVLRAA